MATCITEQLVTAQPRVQLTVTQQSSNSTSVTYAWELEYITGSPSTDGEAKKYSIYADGVLIHEGTFMLNVNSCLIANGAHTIERLTSPKNVIFSVTMNWNTYWNYVRIPSQTASLEMSLPARTSYTITYNANGGTGAPTSQTKFAGTDLILSNTSPTRTGYNFLGWSTSSSATSAAYSAGATFTLNADTTLYAVWSKTVYTIEYNSNGGTGKPANQTKTHNADLVLSTTKPTKTNYTFLGWGVSPNSTTASYMPGDIYDKNASITLYAIWSVAYEPPYVMSLVVDRCTSDGTLADDGTYLKASFEWKTDVAVKSMQARWSESEDFSTYSSYIISHSGTELSGTKTGIIFGGGNIDTEKVYYVRVYVTDNLNNSSYYQVLIPSMKFTMDVLAGGRGV